MLRVWTVEEIAALTNYSPTRIKFAINQHWHKARPKDGKPLPPLPAKKGGHGKFLIFETDLEEWLYRLPDA